MASVISTKAKWKIKALRYNLKRWKHFLEAYELIQTLNLGLDFEAFLQENGFSEFLKQNIKEWKFSQQIGKDTKEQEVPEVLKMQLRKTKAVSNNEKVNKWLP